MRIAVIDPAIPGGFSAALSRSLPQGWTLANEPAGASVLVTESVDVGAEVLASTGTAVRLVVKLDTGNATLDVGDIPTIEVSNAALIGVAEHTVALMLASLRGLVDLDQRTRGRKYLPDRATPALTDQSHYTYNWVGLEDFGTMYGRTVGLVGLGYIGRAVAARMRPFGVKLRYSQRNPLDAATEVELGVTFNDLETLLAESDIVSLHHRFQAGDQGNDFHIDRDAIARMKRGSVFINTARGRLIDEAALADALSSGHLRAAALDVFRYEPLPVGHPFFAIPNSRLLLTPHVAGAPVGEAWRVMSDTIVERALTITKE